LNNFSIFVLKIAHQRWNERTENTDNW